LERGDELEQIRLKVFDLYVTHCARLNPHITFTQFWDDFLINHMISEEVPIEEIFHKTCDKLEVAHVRKSKD
jgi:hypothetical protein